jgi:hypothetical protein
MFGQKNFKPHRNRQFLEKELLIIAGSGFGYSDLEAILKLFLARKMIHFHPKDNFKTTSWILGQPIIFFLGHIFPKPKSDACFLSIKSRFHGFLKA